MRHAILATVLLASCGPAGDTAAPEPLTPTVMQPDSGQDFTDPTTTTTTTGRPSARVSRGRVAAVGDGYLSELLDRLARCESGMNPLAVGGNGRYLGAFQMTRATSRRLGLGDDPRAHSYEVQKAAAAKIHISAWRSQFPACARRLGVA